MRLFFAVTLNPGAADAVRSLQHRLRAAQGDPGLRWTPPEQLHYTLKFLGEVDPGRVPSCSEAAREATAGVRAFSVGLAGIGAFPSASAPRVLWVGASEGAEPLAALALRLDGALADRGFQREERPFKPHLTVARIKGPGAERAARAILESVQAGEIAVSEVSSMVLMQSELSPRGSRYSVVDTYPANPP